MERGAGKQRLGLPFGVSLAVDERGRCRGLHHGGRFVPLIESAGDHLELVRRPTIASRLVVPGPGQLHLPGELVYELANEHERRTVTVFPAVGRIRIEVAGPSAPMSLQLEQGSRWSLESGAGTKPHRATARSAGPERLDISIAVPESGTGPAADGDTLVWPDQPSLVLDVDVRRRSLFASDIVIVGSAEFGAVLSSCYPDLDAYVPVFLVDASIPPSEHRQKAFDTLVHAIGASRYVFGGVSETVTEALLWNRSSEFQSQSICYDEPDAVLADADPGPDAVLRCPRSTLASGLVVARRSGRRLVLDDDAEPVRVRRSRSHVVSHEGQDFEAVVAANLAVFEDADLVATGPLSQSFVTSIADRIRGVGVGPTTDHTDPAEAIASIGRTIACETALELDGATMLTAFTAGIPYGLGYDVPVAHILTPDSADFVVRDLVREESLAADVGMNLLVDTLDFGMSEIGRSLESMAGRGGAVVLAGDAANKAQMLAHMSLLPLALQVVVAHGAPEVVFSEEWLIERGGVQDVVRLNRSSRGAMDFEGNSDVEQDTPTLLGRISSTELKRSPHIEGIQLADTLFTGDDLGLFGSVPVISGLVVNNGCATWTALATAFTRWGARGYVGTLWPVTNASAIHVGLGFLAAGERATVVDLLYELTRDLPPVDRVNYAYVGTSRSRRGGADRDDADPDVAFAVLALAESQFQGVLASCRPEWILPLLSVVESVRTALVPLIDTAGEQQVARFEADLLAVVSARGVEVDLLEAQERSVGALRSWVEAPGGALGQSELREARRDLAQRFGSLVAAATGAGRSDSARMASEDLTTLAETSADTALEEAAARVRLWIARTMGDVDEQERLLADGLERGLLGETEQALLDRLGAPMSVEAAHRRLAESPGRLDGVGGDRVAAAMQLFDNAERLRDSARFEEARRDYERALAVFAAARQPELEAMACNNLAIVLRMLGESDRAADLFERAIATKAQAGLRGLGNSLMNLGDLRAEAGLVEDAKRLYAEALESFERDGSELGMAEVLLQSALLGGTQEPSTEVEEDLRRSVELARRARAWIPLGRALACLGFVEAQSDRPQEALRSLTEAIAIVFRVGVRVPETPDLDVVSRYLALLRYTGGGGRCPTDGPGLYVEAASLLGTDTAQHWLAAFAADRARSGALEHARRLAALDAPAMPQWLRAALDIGPIASDVEGLERAVRAADGDVDLRAQAEAEHSLGLALKREGRLTEALAALERSRTAFAEVGAPEGEAAMAVEIGCTLLDGGAVDEARRLIERGIALYEAIGGHDVLLGRAYNNLGYALRTAGDRSAATEAYEQSISLIGAADDAVRTLVHVNLAEMALENGDLDRARAEFLLVLDLTGGQTPLEAHEQRWRAGAHLQMAMIQALEGTWPEALRSAVLGAELCGPSSAESFLVPTLTSLLAVNDSEAGVHLSSVQRSCIARAIDAAGEEGRDIQCLHAAELVGFGAVDELLDLLAEVRTWDGELALALVEAVLVGEPDHWRAHLGRGLALEVLERHTEADLEYSWCADRDPSHPVPWNNLAHSAQRRGDDEVAVRHADEALARDPLYMDAWDAKIFALVRLERWSAAITAIHSALDAVPASPNQDMWLQLLMGLEARRASETSGDGPAVDG